MNNLYKHIISALILIAFVSCEVVDNINYIQVTITGQAFVRQIDKSDPKSYKPVEGVPVEMELVKAGGERFQKTGITGSNGSTSITTVFNLYKEQPIEFKARLINSPDQFLKTKLAWKDADYYAQMDDSGHRILQWELNVHFDIP